MVLTKNEKIHFLLCFIFVIMMAICADITKEKEIIFPEITALAIGAWLAPKQVWKVNRITMCALITFNAYIGVFISEYITLPLYFKVIIGLIATSTSIYISRSTFFPAISACMLPIFIGTKGCIYPFAAIIMTIIICIVQYILEKKEQRKINFQQNIAPFCKQELVLWCLRLIFIILIAIIPIWLGQYFFIAPPLLVAFVEFTQPESKAMTSFKRIFLLISVCAFSGMICRMVFNIWLRMPLSISTCFSVIVLLVMLYITKVYFPPAGAISVLPMLINGQFLIFYPFEIIIGFIILFLGAFGINILIKHKNSDRKHEGDKI